MDCPICEGVGKLSNGLCPACKGSGEVLVKKSSSDNAVKKLGKTQRQKKKKE